MTRMKSLFAFFKHEFLSVLPPTIYFLCTFNVVVLTTSMVLRDFEITFSAYAFATTLALVIGKVVLVVNKLSVLRKFDGKPLIYPILFKSVVYTLFVFAVRLLEHWIPGLIESGNIAGANAFIVEHVNWRLFSVAQIWVFVLFVVYTTAVEFISIFGLTSRQLLTAFFHEHPTSIRTAD